MKFENTHFINQVRDNFVISSQASCLCAWQVASVLGKLPLCLAMALHLLPVVLVATIALSSDHAVLVTMGGKSEPKMALRVLESKF